jgi:hypothetical protein
VFKCEKGFAIVVPRVRRKKVEKNDGERVTGFGSGQVFDVRQTDGESLPTVQVPTLEGEEGRHLYDRLSGLVAAEGLSPARRHAEATPAGVMGSLYAE